MKVIVSLALFLLETPTKGDAPMQVPPPYPPPYTQPQRYLPPPQQKVNRRLIAVVLLALLLLVVGGTAAVVMLAPSLGQALWREANRPRSSGPSVPWSTQLSVAQQEASKVDKDAVLDDVSASPVQFQPVGWTYTNTLELTFRYLLPNGDALNVMFEDSAPTSTVKTRRDKAYDPERGPERYERLRERQQELTTALTSIKITPRDVARITWQEATTHAAEQGLVMSKLSPLIFPNLYDARREPIKWHISYHEPTLNIGKALEQVLSDFNYDVDAEHGTILKRGYEIP